MKIVIDIQDDVYRVLKEDIYPIPDTERLALVFKTLVEKGTPLSKGHWLEQPRYEGDEQPDLVCPNCGEKISWWDTGNFCANCGTELEGGAG